MASFWPIVNWIPLILNHNSFLFLLSELSALRKVGAPLVLHLVSIERLSRYVDLFNIEVGFNKTLHVTVLKHSSQANKTTFLFNRLKTILLERLRNVPKNAGQILPKRTQTSPSSSTTTTALASTTTTSLTALTTTTTWKLIMQTSRCPWWKLRKVILLFLIRIETDP